MTAQETTIRHDPQTPPGDSTTKRIFIGPNGLRAGWRLLIFMAIIMAMSSVARMILRRFFPDALDPAQLTPMRIIAPDLLVCFILAVAAWVMSKIEGRRPGQYGLPRSEALGKNFRVGLLIGLLATSSTVLAIFALHGCAVGFHLGYDWGQTFLYGVPNSGLLASQSLLNASFSGPRWLTGGAVGPEASIFCPIALAIVAILFGLKYREARYRPLGAPSAC